MKKVLIGFEVCMRGGGSVCIEVLILNMVEEELLLFLNKLLYVVFVFLFKDLVLFFYMYENYSKMLLDGIFLNVDYLVKILF